MAYHTMTGIADELAGRNQRIVLDKHTHSGGGRDCDPMGHGDDFIDTGVSTDNRASDVRA